MGPIQKANVLIAIFEPYFLGHSKLPVRFAIAMVDELLNNLSAVTINGSPVGIWYKVEPNRKVVFYQKVKNHLENQL